MKPIIVSFPRSGRTWLITMIGLVVCYNKGLPTSQAMVERKKYVNATHDRTDKSLKVHADDLSTDKSAYADRRVLFMTRDPKDTLVSAHLHATKRKGNFDGTLSEYIRDPRYGIAKLARFNKIWFANQGVPERFMTISYEGLLDNPEYCLRAICVFLQVPHRPLDIELAVRDSSIEKLRDAEKTGYFEQGIGKPKRPEDVDTYYHRKGGCGGYVDYMTKEDIEYCDDHSKPS